MRSARQCAEAPSCLPPTTSAVQTRAFPSAQAPHKTVTRFPPSEKTPGGRGDQSAALVQACSAQSRRQALARASAESAHPHSHHASARRAAAELAPPAALQPIERAHGASTRPQWQAQYGQMISTSPPRQPCPPLPSRASPASRPTSQRSRPRHEPPGLTSSPCTRP